MNNVIFQNVKTLIISGIYKNIFAINIGYSYATQMAQKHKKYLKRLALLEIPTEMLKRLRRKNRMNNSNTKALR